MLIAKLTFLLVLFPACIFYRQGTSGAYVQVYKSEIIEKTLTPQWKPFNVDLGVLCNNNLDQEFVIEVSPLSHFSFQHVCSLHHVCGL